MAFSIQRAVSDGTMTLLPVSIEYFDREEISVLFNGVLNARQWAWVGTTDKTLSFTPAVADTVEVMVVRSTDLSALRHQFSLGAQFTAESLDESLLQVLHIAQEATERQLGGDFFTDIDMHGSQITNLGAATAPDHAVTLAQYQADASGASAAKDTAVASASTAVAASNSASASASAALISANNADVSEFNALSSASSASASASTASTKAAEAAASAAAALVSKNASALAESNAKASEVAAAASAAAALHPWEAEAEGIHYDLGNVRIGGVGKRITGDFSNATIANRVMFQTSTVSGNTNINAIPATGGVSSSFEASTAPIGYAASVAQLFSLGTDVRLAANVRDGGTFLPMTFYTGGSERMRIDANGNANVGMAGGGSKFNVLGNVELRGAQNGTATAVIAFLKGADGTQAGYWGYGSTLSPMEYVNNRGTGHVFQDNGVERLRIGPSGNVLVSSPGGLGYGTGSGGTVTQSTSKSTTVTLNKPTGQITMNNAALAAGASVAFTLNNSLISNFDSLLVNAFNNSSYRVEVSYIASGTAAIRVTNVSGVSLSEALPINFAIIKGATL